MHDTTRPAPPHLLPTDAQRVPPRIAVLIGAEAYQAYHVADIAWELADRGADVEVVATLPETLDEMDRLTRSDRDRTIRRRLLRTSPALRMLQSLRILGSLKTRVLRGPTNLALLSSYDAIVTPTDHARVIRARLKPCPLMIYINHGLGGRGASYSNKYLGFDFVVLGNEVDEERLLARGYIRPGFYVVAGYPKFETADRLAAFGTKLFDNDRPIVLFNPHSKRSLRSWERFAKPLIEHAAAGEFNLIVAPHVKLFARRPSFIRRRWERRSVPGRVIVDLGSQRLLDMSYTKAADIYAGDVSSQIYEFLDKPKPCVFLNAHRLPWQGNADFPNWDLGDVVDTPKQAIQAIRQASERHPLYVKRQEERIAAALDRRPGAAGRAADAILDFIWQQP